MTQATRKAVSAGDIAALAGRGVDALDPYIARCLPDLVLAAAVPVTLAVVIGAFDWVSAIALASVLVLFPVFGVLVGASSNDLAARRWRHVEAFARQIADVFEGLPLLKALGQSARQRERIALASDALRVASLSTLRIAFLSALVLDTLASVSVALVAVPLGLRLLNGSISLAAALAVLIMAPEVFLPLRRASAEFHESNEGLAAARRAMDVIDAAVCEGDPYPKHAVPDPVHATVALRNVRVEFAGTPPPILDGASLEVAPGEHVVVVGTNGAGKSSALSLVLGLLGAARGTVTVGGRDLRGADLDAWRRHIAYLPEHPTLIAASLADNLRLAIPQSTRADLMGALEQAGAGVFVDTLPAGLDTVLGDGGRTVSMGERQRIAVARVLLREASLYLLDEPTAHLDAAAEHAVIEALRRRLTGRSALIITHSSAVTLLGDRVLELNAGCFVPGARRARTAGTRDAGDARMTTDADRVAATENRSVSAARLAATVAPVPWRHLAATAGAGIVTATASIGLLTTSAWVITRSSQRPPVFALAVAMGAVQAFALARGLSRYAERLAVHAAALHTLSRLRLWLFDVLEPLMPGGVPGRGTGAVLNGFVSGVDSVSSGLAKKLTTMIDVGASTVIGVVVAAIVLPAAGGLLLGAAAALIIVSIGIMRIARPAVAAPDVTGAQVAGDVVDIVHGAPELLMYGRLDLVERRLKDLHKRALSASWRQALILGIARGVVVITSAAALTGVLLTGLTAHAAGQLSGVMLAVLVFVGLAVLGQIAVLPAALAGAAAGDASAWSLAALATAEPVVQEPATSAHPLQSRGTVAVRHARVDAPHAPDAAPILDDVSLRVSSGARVALVGRSGSGKSSVLHTVLHFLETSSGATIIDGADVRTMQRGTIAQRVAWMPETPHIFDATLADNLRIARPLANDHQCVDALRRVGLGQWFGTLPDALQTRLGPVGRAMSAGERQRLSMARALLWDTPALLLDEPTAHLDPGSDMHALRGLFDAAAARSVLIVTHKRGIGDIVDHVATLEHGKVVRPPSSS